MLPEEVSPNAVKHHWAEIPQHCRHRSAVLWCLATNGDVRKKLPWPRNEIADRFSSDPVSRTLWKPRTIVMFRVVLAACYLLLALAGPTPCCCSLSRLMTTASAWVGTESLPELSSRCCEPVVEVTSDESEGTSDQDSDSQAPSRPHCDCEMKLLSNIPSRTELPSTDGFRSWIEAVVGLSALTVRPQIIDADSSEVCRDNVPVPKSGRDLRIALRSWRC